MLNSSLSDYSDAYIHVKGVIIIPNIEAATALVEKKTFQNCAPFTDCISEKNNVLVDNAKDIDVVTSMHNLICHSNIYLKTSESLWQYYRDKTRFK